MCILHVFMLACVHVCVCVCVCDEEDVCIVWREGVRVRTRVRSVEEKEVIGSSKFAED